MPIALPTEVVTAKVGQRPSAMIKTGFSVMMPFLMRLMHSFISEHPPFSVDAVLDDIQCGVDCAGDGS